MDASTSPFSKHINTNYIPESNEIDQIKSLIGDRQKIVNNIDAQIAQLHAGVKALEESRKQHTNYIEEHHALISPVRHLPLDVLKYIFRVGNGWWKAHHEVFVDGKADKLPFIVTVSHVCKDWRRIVLGMPDLWTRIELKAPIFPGVPETPAHHALGLFTANVPVQRNNLPVSVQKQLHQNALVWKWRGKTRANMVKTYIERSADLPLHIYLGTESTYGRHGADSQFTNQEIGYIEFQKKQFRDLLMPTVRRWKTAQLNLYCDTNQSPLLDLLSVTPESAPLLQTLELSIRVRNDANANGMTQLFTAGPPSGWIDRLPQFTLLSAPALTDLRLRVRWSEAQRLPINWKNLKKLDFDPVGATLMSGEYFRTNEALALLSRCPNLVDCSINFHGTDIKDPNPATYPSAITLKHLKRLDLRGYTQRLGLAAKLVTPALKELGMSLYTIPTDETGPLDAEQNPVYEWIDRYGEQLTKIGIEYSSLTHDGFVKCLSRLPNLEDLGLSGFYNTQRSLFLYGHGGAIVNLPQEKKPARLNDDLLKLLTPVLEDDGEGGKRFAEECLCPKLQSLWCNVGPGELDSGEEAFINLIAARRNPELTKVVVGAGGEKAKVLKNAMLNFMNLRSDISIVDELKMRGVDPERFSLDVRSARGLRSRG